MEGSAVDPLMGEETDVLVIEELGADICLRPQSAVDEESEPVTHAGGAEEGQHEIETGA